MDYHYRNNSTTWNGFSNVGEQFPKEEAEAEREKLRSFYLYLNIQFSKEILTIICLLRPSLSCA
jgi:hypothetical protein